MVVGDPKGKTNVPTKSQWESGFLRSRDHRVLGSEDLREESPWHGSELEGPSRLNAHPNGARSTTSAQLRLGEPIEVPDMIQPPLHVLGKSLQLQRVVGAQTL